MSEIVRSPVPPVGGGFRGRIALERTNRGSVLAGGEVATGLVDEGGRLSLRVWSDNLAVGHVGGRPPLLTYIQGDWIPQRSTAGSCRIGE